MGNAASRKVVRCQQDKSYDGGKMYIHMDNDDCIVRAGGWMSAAICME
jgi:hypothetical protein